MPTTQNLNNGWLAPAPAKQDKTEATPRPNPDWPFLYSYAGNRLYINTTPPQPKHKRLEDIESALF
jgi:hypothetical protein